METWDALRSRRNVRDYEDRPIADADLDRILESARRTPSSKNRQRWDVVVVTDRDRLERLAKVWRGAGHMARSAATIGLVAPVADPDLTASVHYDLGQMTMGIMLAAADLGIGSGHAAVHDQDLAREIRVRAGAAAAGPVVEGACRSRDVAVADQGGVGPDEPGLPAGLHHPVRAGGDPRADGMVR